MPRRRSLVLALAALLACGGAAWGQDALQPMRDLIDRGYWHSAAQLTGPALVAQHPDDPEAHFLYATALYLTGDVAAAADRLSLATSLVRGGVPPSHVHLAALIRADEGDPVGAVRQLQNAFLREPDYRYAMDWGRIAWQAGLLDEAEAAFRAASATEEGSRQEWPHIARGRLLSAQGRWDEAVEAYLRALDVYEAHDPGGPRLPGPGYVEAWYLLGEAYEAQGRLREAEAAYRAARSVDPNHGPAVQAVDRLARRGE